MLKLLKFLVFLSAILLLAQCNSREVKPIKRDTSITSKISFNNLFFDTSALYNFLDSAEIENLNQRQQIINFYRKRNFQFAWFDTSGIAEQAKSFMNLQADYIFKNKDSSLFNSTLHQFFDNINSSAFKPKNNFSQILETELLLTRQFFIYANKVYKGSDINTDELEWFIPRKKLSVTAMLDSLIKNKGNRTDQYEPLNKQYRLLENALVKYYEMQKKYKWDSLIATQKKYQPGDSLPIISEIKKRLFAFGDLKEDDVSNNYDVNFKNAVQQFQHRHGLYEDGIIGANTLYEINKPLKNRIQQILVNMERARWLPEESDENYISVNIPEFKLDVYEKRNLLFSMNVVVGTVANSTVVFYGNLKYVVFSPYWNVPESIVINEIVPKMKKNPNYLIKENMEITGYKTNSVPIIRQKSGPNNSLGYVKFLFPNSHNIYFHDTPSRHLFSSTKRNFSHGCIRISEPFKMAKYLLRNDSLWNKADSTITNAMHLGKEKWVSLKKTIPVYIKYFTAWIDKDGVLNFRYDIYKHDLKMQEKLFNK